MSILLPLLAARWVNTPLMIDPGKLAAIVMGFGGRMVDGSIEFNGAAPIQHTAFENGRPSMGRIGDPVGRAYEAQGLGARILDRVGSVGIIPIEGTLVHKGAFLGQSSGETSYQGIQTRVARARRDDSIKGVVFEVDSYGGEVAGAFETAAMIAELSKEKPTLAILTDHAYSAGYLLASAARQIVMPETGGAGSIGAITMHADLSRKLENDGIKVTVISAGARKADGHPAYALSEDVRASIQARVDRSRDVFATAVGSYRGKRLDKAAALATEADSFSGVDAVNAGLIDGLVDPSKAFHAFVGKLQ